MIMKMKMMNQFLQILKRKIYIKVKRKKISILIKMNNNHQILIIILKKNYSQLIIFLYQKLIFH